MQPHAKPSISSRQRAPLLEFRLRLRQLPPRQGLFQVCADVELLRSRAGVSGPCCGWPRMNSLREGMLPDPECAWRAAGLAVRLCTDGDEPRLIPRYLEPGDDLIRQFATAEWRVVTQTASLLLRTTADHALPLHWRSLCADYLYLPLRRLARHAQAHARADELRALRTQLLQLRLAPAPDSSTEPDLP
jgi:hypothetical protein